MKSELTEEEKREILIMIEASDFGFAEANPHDRLTHGLTLGEHSKIMKSIYKKLGGLGRPEEQRLTNKSI